MKKLLSLILVAVMLLTAMPIAFAEGNTYKVGDIIQFGSYPQSKVTDSGIISMLNSIKPKWDNWTSYGYYTGTGYYGTMVQGDWMRYTDIMYNGNKYRGVRFTQNRPYYTYCASYLSYEYTHQTKNGYNITTSEYWFKFEPIDWRVLDPDTGLVMCETIIDSQPYSDTIYESSFEVEYFNDYSRKNYANDYETSSIRKWLNNDFYNTAFTDSEKKEISTTTLNNDGYYTSVGTTGYEKLDSNETKDKIFLLSYNEVRNSNFGFNSSSSASDTARFGKGSDYAQSQGLYVYRSSGSTYNGNSYWLLRSPGDDTKYCCYVDYYGSSRGGYFCGVADSDCGIRPALCLEIIKHKHTYDEFVTTPTCTTNGYTTYICECGDKYVANYVYAKGHGYTSQVTIPATHLTKGVKTYTCHCGDTYIKPIPKLEEHTYTSIVTTEPTHTKMGVKTFTCECGDSYTEAIEKTTKHTYTSEVTKEATHLTEGEITYTCTCGDTYTEAIPKLDKHAHIPTITTPTCTTQGYTTYTCECGDTYVADYVDTNGHSFTDYISDGKATCTTDGSLIAKCDYCDATDTKPEKGTHKFSDSFAIDLDPTCTTVGQKSRHCVYCTEKTDITPIGKLAHTYNTITIDPTCTDRGHKIYTCTCGDSYTETLPALGHNFSGSVCTECDYDKADDCTCNCHKTGLSALIWKILNFFYRLLRLNPTCNCGIAHY